MIFQKCLEPSEKGTDRCTRVHLIGIDGLETFCHFLKNVNNLRIFKPSLQVKTVFQRFFFMFFADFSPNILFNGNDRYIRNKGMNTRRIMPLTTLGALGSRSNEIGLFKIVVFKV